MQRITAINSTLLEGEGAFALTAVTEKGQGSEIHENGWVFQVLLTGVNFVPIKTLNRTQGSNKGFHFTKFTIEGQRW